MQVCSILILVVVHTAFANLNATATIKKDLSDEGIVSNLTTNDVNKIKEVPVSSQMKNVTNVKVKRRRGGDPSTSSSSGGGSDSKSGAADSLDVSDSDSDKSEEKHKYQKGLTGEGCPRYRGKDVVDADLCELIAENWQDITQDQERWHSLVSEAKIHFGSFIEPKERKWHRKCTPCPTDMVKKWRDPSINWICGGYQRARRSFKSVCMMHYRNCQDGTMFVMLHREKCPDVQPGLPKGKHFFYDYKVVLSEDSSTSNSESDEESEADSSDSTYIF